jgi:3-mercaptopyruvate sulfurtransferase SseA
MKTNRVKVLIFTLIAGLVFLTGCTATKTAKVQQVKPAWVFHDIVDVNFVKANRGVPMPANVMIVDSRPCKSKFVKGHIPGAINIPFSQFDKNIDQLPKDKDSILIFYCQGPT